MTPLRLHLRPWLIPAGACFAALVMVSALGRPWLGSSNDPDSMNSVLFFQRILEARRLEVTVLTTPKPLLTLVFGATWSSLHNWTALVWETIVVYSAAVALTTSLAMRLAGIAAGLFVATALVLSPVELTEVMHANSMPFALAGWAAAGLAVTAQRPRWAAAGGALLVAGLARTETWLILGVATIAVVALATPWIRSRAPHDWPRGRSAAPILVAWLALPLQALHDLLLTGNPLYTLSVPTAYTQLLTPGLASVSPLQFAHDLLNRHITPFLVPLALVGLGYLVYRRSWATILGLSAITIGGLLLVGYLAWRGIYVSYRYYEEPGLGLVFLAAIGAGGMVAALRGATARSPIGSLVGATLATGLGVAAVAAISLGGPGTGEFVSSVRALQQADRNLELVSPLLRRIVSASQPAPEAIPYGSGFLRADPERATLFVPGPLLGRVAVESDASLTRFGDLTLAFRSAPPAKVLRAGQMVYHDPLVDGPPAVFRPLEVSEPRRLDGLTLTPIALRPGSYWLVRIDAPG